MRRLDPEWLLSLCGTPPSTEGEMMSDQDSQPYVAALDKVVCSFSLTRGSRRLVLQPRKEEGGVHGVRQPERQ